MFLKQKISLVGKVPWNSFRQEVERFNNKRVFASLYILKKLASKNIWNSIYTKLDGFDKKLLSNEPPLVLLS